MKNTEEIPKDLTPEEEAFINLDFPKDPQFKNADELTLWKINTRRKFDPTWTGWKDIPGFRDLIKEEDI